MSVCLIFDNTPLSHFARAGRLDVLAALSGAYRCICPAQVMQELAVGATAHPVLARVRGLDWLEVVELTDVEEVVAFARYKGELGG